MKFYCEISGGYSTEMTVEAMSERAAIAKCKKHFASINIDVIAVAFCDLDKTDKVYELTFPNGDIKIVQLEGDLPTSTEENKKQLWANHGQCKIKRIYK